MKNLIIFCFIILVSCHRKNKIEYQIQNNLNQVSLTKAIDDSLVLVEGGTFLMGSSDLTYINMPEHLVIIDSFFICKTMITVSQFNRFISATNYKTSAEKDSGSFVFNGTKWEIRKDVNWRCDESGKIQSTINNFNPVLHVSPEDATQFCNWLRKLTGKNYRLPTEAEWEYAAKGGKKSKHFTYSGSNNIDDVAWYGGNSGLKIHPVAQKKANELGLYDMSGNAWEWCADWYSASYNYNADSVVKNPKGPKTGEEKICRGGSYLSGSGLRGDEGVKEQCKPTSRGKEFNNLGASDGSFRVICEKQ